MGNGNAQKMAQIRSERFVSHAVSDLQAANSSPIDGYQHLPMETLERSVEKLIHIVPGLKIYVGRAKDNCNQNSILLTHNQSAAIYLYSMQTPFYSCFNVALRAKNREALKPWFPFLRLFLSALEKLPSLETVIWRGVAQDVGSGFGANNTQTWWSVNSCSTDLRVVQVYLGETEGTVFAIAVMNGKNISDYSAYKDEQEVVLMCGTHLYVKSDPLSFQDRLSIVHLEEIGGKKASKSHGAASGSLVHERHANPSAAKSPNVGVGASGGHSANQNVENLALVQSLDLTMIRNKPFRIQSVRESMRSYGAKILSSSDKLLLVSDGKVLLVFDENLTLLHTVKNQIFSSNEILDITWSASLGRFIVLSKTNAYVFDPITTILSRIESIRLQNNEERFISSAYMNKTLFIAISKSYHPFYIDSYHLPGFTFVRRFTMIELIGNELPRNNPLDRIEIVKKPQDDKREVNLIRSVNGRLGLIMKIEYDCYFYIVNLLHQPFNCVKTKLPSRDCRLTALVCSHEWVIVSDSDNSIMQISLDCEFKTEYTAKRDGTRDKANDVVMLGSSCLVVLRRTDLEMYQRVSSGNPVPERNANPSVAKPLDLGVGASASNGFGGISANIKEMSTPNMTCIRCDGSGRRIYDKSDCRGCNGTGHHRAGVVPCIRCDGVGQRGIERDICKGCDGKGYHASGFMTCIRCDGAGQRGIERSNCKGCDGKGYHAPGFMECIRCDGAGQRGIERKDCKGCDGKGYHRTNVTECDQCDGSGQSDGLNMKDCHRCNGKGYVS